MEPFDWQCPFCNHHSTITSSNFHDDQHDMSIKNVTGDKSFYSFFIVCPNKDCRKYTLTAILFNSKYGNYGGHYKHGDLKEINRWNLVPNSSAKVFPDYIPKPIKKDYEEACSIKELSPKASATLSRRCLQGMIRDFWSIKKSRLIDEIEAIKDKVDPLTWDSIEAVRKIGNIGAHMEKDINIIVDVEPNEAELLIHLIEVLIKDWYINKHEREEKLKKLIGISGKKDAEKKP